LEETYFLISYAGFPYPEHIQGRIIYNMDSMNNLFSRLGSFFTLVGCALLILFIWSILAGEIHAAYFLFAAASLILGFIFHRAAPRPEPTRFEGIRKARQRSRQRREEKQTRKDETK
jgi:hypothetical protein